jgi:hypothetical protein
MIAQSRIRCVRVITSSSKKAGWHIRQATGIAFTGIVEVKPPPRSVFSGGRGILERMAELSVAFSPLSLKLRRALLAIHPHVKPSGILAKERQLGWLT